jgi:hypothetical protein
MSGRQFFVDVEWLIGNNDELIVKELSVLEYASDNVSTFHLYPPTYVNESLLSGKVRANNHYVQQYRHGFTLNSGVTQYSKMSFVFKLLFSRHRSCTVYVKGDEKLNLLRRIIDQDYKVMFVELGKLGCPKYSLSTLHSCNNRCLLFSQNVRHLYCTESKVKFFADWFRGR